VAILAHLLSIMVVFGAQVLHTLFCLSVNWVFRIVFGFLKTGLWSSMFCIFVLHRHFDVSAQLLKLLL